MSQLINHFMILIMTCRRQIMQWNINWYELEDDASHCSWPTITSNVKW